MTMHIENNKNKNKTAQKIKSNFFLLKSKHTQQNFQNHPYFALRMSRYPSEISHIQNISRQFVDTPTEFGLQNTYNYLVRESIFQWKNNNKEVQRRISTDPQRYKKDTASSYWRKSCVNNFLPKVTTGYKFQKTTQSIDNENIPQHWITFIYTKKLTNFSDIIFNKVEINIVPYIKDCFLKSKIVYDKITQQQFNQITRMIKVAINSPASKFSAQNCVNIPTIQQLFQYLGQLKQESVEWCETVKYFFIPKNSKTIEFQMLKLRDQVNQKIQTKMNIKFIVQNMIFRSDNGAKVQKLYELLDHNIFLYDEQEKCHKLYQQLIKNHQKNNSFQNKIKKWKSIAPATNKQQVFITISSSSYKKIYQKYSDRHKKYLQSKKKPSLKLKTSFIDKSKLNQSQEIFQ